MSCLFTSGGPSIGASAAASVLPMNIQDLFPLRLTSLISFQEYWSAISFSRSSSPNPGIEPMSSASAGGFFTSEPPEKLTYV